jgi:hypothetical protein
MRDFLKKSKGWVDLSEADIARSLQRESLELYLIINIACPRGKPLDERHGGAHERHRDLKAAIDSGKLLAASRGASANLWSVIDLADLWAFAVSRGPRWEWLREFCKRWAAEGGHELAEHSAPQLAPPATGAGIAATTPDDPAPAVSNALSERPEERGKYRVWLSRRLAKCLEDRTFRGMKPSDLAKHMRKLWERDSAAALAGAPLVPLPKNRHLVKVIEEMLSEPHFKQMLSEPPQEQIRANKSKEGQVTALYGRNLGRFLSSHPNPLHPERDGRELLGMVPAIPVRV